VWRGPAAAQVEGAHAREIRMTISATITRVELTIDPPVAHISLHNPPLNVIDLQMMEELGRALAGVDARKDLSMIVIEGAERDFSAGVDIAAHTPDKVESMLAKFHGVIRSLVATKKATIAAVRGHCLGGGSELAMVCDLVYTAENAQWGFPEIKLACYPPVAAVALSALVGQKRAADLILTGRTITGSEAAQIGLANSAMADRDLHAAIRQAVDRLSQLSPAALAVTKKAIYAWDSIHFDKGLARAEKIYLEELMKTEDAQEGINAFLDKRQPMWKRGS
jgi:cyclohexa-1,5-dienecarbonyl-CoA hydratase